jgi:putative peptidoglycan lipid II flippase
VAGVLLGSTGVGQDLLDRVGEGVGVKDPEPAAKAVQLAGPATSFDPEGDGEENESEAGLATDGNPATAWRTDHYNSRVLPPFKAGVGLVVPVASASELRELKVLTTNSEGWAAEVFVADGPQADLGGWGEAVDRKENLGNEATFDLKGRSGSAVLIWLTDVGANNRAEITEVTVSA